MKEWIFHVCRNLLRWPCGIVIRKAHFDGTGNFVKDKPVFIASNHPNSFLDGVIYQHFSRRKVYTLTRGDVFLKPVTNYIFRGMRLLPIFRARDASVDIARKGNSSTYDELFDRFTKGDNILIFTEGNSYPEKSVRRLKKGTAQIAIEMVKRSDFTLDLHLLPSGLNYSEFGTLMQTVHVQYSKPIRVLDYKDKILNDEREVQEELTTLIGKEFQKNVVITKGDHTEEKEYLQQMMINENYQPLIYKTLNKWKFSVKKLNDMSDSLAEEVMQYKKSVEKNKVLDANVGNRSFDYLSTFMAIVTLGFSFPIYIVWWLLWKGTVALVKAKIKNIVFVDSMITGAGMIQSTILMIVVGVLCYSNFSPLWATLFWAGGMYGALCWFRVVDTLPYFYGELLWLGKSDKTKEDLEQKRKAILSQIA